MTELKMEPPCPELGAAEAATVPLGAPMTLADLYAIHEALNAITFEEFDDALTRAFHRRDTSYARGVYGTFRSSPVGFLKWRQPQSQAEELFRVALEKMKKR